MLFPTNFFLNCFKSCKYRNRCWFDTWILKWHFFFLRTQNQAMLKFCCLHLFKASIFCYIYGVITNVHEMKGFVRPFILSLLPSSHYYKQFILTIYIFKVCFLPWVKINILNVLKILIYHDRCRWSWNLFYLTCIYFFKSYKTIFYGLSCMTKCSVPNNYFKSEYFYN